MYNHYQNSCDYIPVETGPSVRPSPPDAREHRTPTAPPIGTGSSLQQLFSGIAGTLKFDRFDTGDILLVLIILFLLLEGDNLELIITLGLVLLLGLGEPGEDPFHPAT